MKKLNKLFSFLLVLALLVSCFPVVFAAEGEETKAETKAVKDDEVIVADWLWGSVMDARGAATIMKEYAETGYTDIYLLIKGTGGTCSWNSSVSGAAGTSGYSYDLLQSAIDAAKPYGIRIHAWMMAALDSNYMKTHANENYYHFRYGYSNTVNQCVNLRGANYQNYFTSLVKELSTKYPDLAGIHLDTIRYNGMWYDWGYEARTELINNYGMTKGEWNAAVKALCVSANYTYTTNSEGYYVFNSSGSTSGTSLASALASSADNDTTRGVKKVQQMRIDTVNNFIKAVKGAMREDMILTTAIMPDASVHGAYAQFEYGQQPKTMAPLLDYICTMTYASTYQCEYTWPGTMCKAITDVGGNVVAAIQYFDNESTSGGPTNTRIYNEINHVMTLRDSINNDTSDSTGKILGYAIFRNGFGVYGGAKIEDDSTMTIYAHNQLSSNITKLIIKAKGNVTFGNVSNKSGWSGCTFTMSSDKKTLTITGSSLLNAKGNSSFTLTYSGTFTEATGACMMDAYTSSGAVYTVCNTYGTSCDHQYVETVVSTANCTTAGKSTFTCSLCGDSYTETVPALGHAYELSYDEATLTSTFTCKNCGDSYSSSCSDGHARVETWAETENTHFAFCYNCNAGYTETCHFVETARTEATCTTAGSVTYTCAGTVGGVHDAYSGMGCGNTYTEVIPAGHSYGTSKDNGDGTHSATCSACGTAVTEAHTEVVLPGKDATCTETGLTEGKTCSTCKAVIVAQTEIPKKGHTEVVTPAVAATCTAEGKTEGKTCSVCNEVLVAATVIPAKGHTEVVIPGTPATCIAAGVSDGSYCSVCGQTVKEQAAIPATGHTEKYVYEDEDGHITECENCYYSKYEPHVYTNGVCVCGDTNGAAPSVDSALKINHSLDLASDISVNFVVASNLLSGYDMNTVYMEVKANEYKNNAVIGSTTVKLYPTLKGSYYYFTYEGLNATNMNNMLAATLYGTKNGNAVCSAVDNYSVATYAYSQLGKANASDKLKTLCADLLRYGADAQTYKSYRTDALANAKMTAAHKAYLTDLNSVAFSNNDQYVSEITNPTVTWVGKTLLLDSKVTLRYVVNLANYSGSVEDLSLRVSYVDIEGNTKNVVIEDATLYKAGTKMYAFDFDQLRAAELRQVVSAAIYEGNTRMTSILQYSAASYGNGKTGNLLAVCKSLVAYSDSALAYFQ